MDGPTDALAAQRKSIDAMLAFFLELFCILALGGAAAALLYGLLAGTGTGPGPGAPIAPHPATIAHVRAPTVPASGPTSPTAGATSGTGSGAETAVDGVSLVAAVIALALCAGAAAVGAGTGFLFGLPRSPIAGEARPATPPPSGTPPSTAALPPSGAYGANGQTLATNTNLEQISDWLTKIIVGVGLTNLNQLPGAVEAFGDRTALEFGVGGKVFGIAAGLYFLILGFLIGYILTRTRLTWIFVGSARETSVIDDTYGAYLSAVKASAAEGVDPKTAPIKPPAPPAPAPAPAASDALFDAGPPVARPAPPPNAPPATTPADVVKADRTILDRSLIAVNSQQELAARAAAEARAGRVAIAAALYGQVVRDDPASPYLVDYAAVLGLLGSRSAATQIVDKVGRVFPARQDEARRGMLVGLLRAGLNNNNFEDAIAAGEELIARPDEKDDAWARLWLACALGQRHARLKAANAEDPTLPKLADRVADLLEQAVKLDRGKVALIGTLYDPALQQGGDDDLQSLRPNARIDALLGGWT